MSSRTKKKNCICLLVFNEKNILYLNGKNLWGSKAKENTKTKSQPKFGDYKHTFKQHVTKYNLDR